MEIENINVKKKNNDNDILKTDDEPTLQPKTTQRHTQNKTT